jgi:hypothetical protein
MTLKKVFFLFIAFNTISFSAMAEEMRILSSSEVLSIYGKVLRNSVAPQSLTEISRERNSQKEFEILRPMSTVDLVRLMPVAPTADGESIRTLSLREQLAFVIGAIKLKLQANRVLSTQEKELLVRTLESK